MPIVATGDDIRFGSAIFLKCAGMMPQGMRHQCGGFAN
jgi:hypothetical protein